MEGKSITGTVAQVADGLSHNGYDDWFLPSKDELGLMYQNLARDDMGGFDSYIYFSSSEEVPNGARGSQFASSANVPGHQYGIAKLLGWSGVRAVRAF